MRCVLPATAIASAWMGKAPSRTFFVVRVSILLGILAARNVALGGGQERPPDRLEELAVGQQTAAEIGWR